MSQVFHDVVVATDFGPSSARALEIAMRLVEGTDGKLTVVHVPEVPVMAYAGLGFSTADVVGAIEEAAGVALEEAMKAVRARVPAAKSALRRGPAWQAILDVAAEEKADLVVLGTHGRHGIPHALLGSVAEKVVRMSPVPVTTVRGA